MPEIVSALTWPIAILVAFATLALAVFGFAKRYVKVPPEKALILAGRGGTKVVTGGAKLVLPVLWDHYYLDLTAFEFPADLKGVQDSNRVEISLKAIVVCKVPNDEAVIKTAAAVFGRKEPRQIASLTQSAFEGHVRSAIGKMTVQEIISEREKLSQTIKSEAEPELAKLGISLVTLNIQEISDHAGYIKALGTQETARVLADAKIREAEQLRRSTIETTNAQREAEKTKADNEAQIADAHRDLQMKQAQYDAQVQREQATAKQAGPLAEAEARKAVVKAEVAVKREQTEAEISLQEAVACKTEAELNATVLKHADAEKRRLQVEAEGHKAASVIKANGEREKLVIEAEGSANARLQIADAERQALEMEGKGRAAKLIAEGTAAAENALTTGKAEAQASEAQMLADAAGKRALADAEKVRLMAEAEGRERLLLAEAAGKKADADAFRSRVLAEAEGVEAQLLAQARGMKELMYSYEGLTPEQQALLKLKWTLEAMPEIVDKLGAAGEKIMKQIADSITASLGTIDNVTVYDSGGGQNGGGGLERFLKTSPNLLLEIGQLLKASGTGPVVAGVLNKVGIDISQFVEPETKTLSAGK